MARVEIARFVDRECVDLALAFFRLHGIHAATLDCGGHKSEAYVKVLVTRDKAARAYDLLKRAQDGAFVEGYPNGSKEMSDAAIALTRGLHGSGYKGADPAWLNLLPIMLVAFLLIAPLVFHLLKEPVSDWVEIQMTR
ncbi:MAG: hypothetical protein EON91_09335 [Brevundimonas sp.]|uniref:hypothetical protein n=1 Tax=Brevundimonas sp. TaxID=1871086 RepID=UPI00121074F1|nr:hypothetical protein [Brevundimonas sp.]RZJ17458.1 MAG: hypothetical protein EON91_09335 [Brevundimonas sp.]